MRRSERDWMEDDEERTRVFVEETVRAATRARARNGVFPPIGRQLAAWVWAPPRSRRRAESSAANGAAFDASPPTSSDEVSVSPGPRSVFERIPGPSPSSRPAPSRASSGAGSSPGALLAGLKGTRSATSTEHRQQTRGARLRVAAASVAVAVVGLGSLGGAGALPQPLQDFMAVTVARVGLDMPPSQGPADEEIPGARRPSSSSTTIADDSESTNDTVARSRSRSRRGSSSTTSLAPSAAPGVAETTTTVTRPTPSTSTPTSTTVPETTTTTVGTSGDPDPVTTTTQPTTTTAPPPAEPRDPPT